MNKKIKDTKKLFEDLRDTLSGDEINQIRTNLYKK